MNITEAIKINVSYDSKFNSRTFTPHQYTGNHFIKKYEAHIEKVLKTLDFKILKHKEKLTCIERIKKLYFN